MRERKFAITQKSNSLLGQNTLCFPLGNLHVLFRSGRQPMGVRAPNGVVKTMPLQCGAYCRTKAVIFGPSPSA